MELSRSHPSFSVKRVTFYQSWKEFWRKEWGHQTRVINSVLYEKIYVFYFCSKNWLREGRVNRTQWKEILKNLSFWGNGVFGPVYKLGHFNVNNMNNFGIWRLSFAGMINNVTLFQVKFLHCRKDVDFFVETLNLKKAAIVSCHKRRGKRERKIKKCKITFAQILIILTSKEYNWKVTQSLENTSPSSHDRP